jgi:hypothetical protein
MSHDLHDLHKFTADRLDEALIEYVDDLSTGCITEVDQWMRETAVESQLFHAVFTAISMERKLSGDYAAILYSVQLGLITGWIARQKYESHPIMEVSREQKAN